MLPPYPRVPHRKGDDAEFNVRPVEKEKKAARKRPDPCEYLHEGLAPPGIVGHRGEKGRCDRHHKVSGCNRPRIEDCVDDPRTEKTDRKVAAVPGDGVVIDREYRGRDRKLVNRVSPVVHDPSPDNFFIAFPYGLDLFAFEHRYPVNLKMGVSRLICKHMKI